MARLIGHEQNGPYEVKPEGAEEPIWICQCGLTNSMPHCDGSHKQASGEEAEGLFVYEKSERMEP